MLGRNLSVLLPFFVHAGCVLKLPDFPPLNVNPDVLPRAGEVETFADIRLGEGLIDWQPFQLEISRKLREQVSTGHESLTIRGNGGKNDYECYLPDKSSLTQIEDDLSKGSSSHLQELKTRVDAMRRSCLSFTYGHWEFSICPMKQVRMLRRERKPGTMATNSLFPAAAQMGMPEAVKEMMGAILGRAEHDVIIDEYFVGRYIPDDPTSDRVVNGRLVQHYVDGDICEGVEGLNGEPIHREAEVSYECSLVQPLDHVLDVTEVSSCKYSIRVGSPRLCASQSMLASSRRAIKCFPITEPVFAPKTNYTSGPSKENTNKKQQSANKDGKKKKAGKPLDFWTERLAAFMQQDQDRFPLIHKIMADFMQGMGNEAAAAGAAGPIQFFGPNDEVSEAVLNKFLGILGIDPEANGDENPDEEEGGDGSSSDKKKRKPTQDHVVFRFEL